jgi:hypothetical protein
MVVDCERKQSAECRRYSAHEDTPAKLFEDTFWGRDRGIGRCVPWPNALSGFRNHLKLILTGRSSGQSFRWELTTW